MIELRHLRALVALAEELSFTRAAARLHLAQQALSTQIRQLEERVGVELVSRTTRRVALTPAGEAFLAHARTAIAEAERAEAAAREVASGGAGRLTLGLSATAALDVTPLILRAFAAGHPKVEVVLRNAEWMDQTGGVLAGEADVALVRPPISAGGLELLTLLEEPRVAVLPPSHPLAGREELDPEEIIDEPWIWVREAERDPVAADFWTLAEHRGGRPLNVGATISGAEDLFEVVRSGLAIAVSPRSFGRAAPDLRFPVVRGIAPATVALAWRSGDPNPLVAAFAAVATRVAGTSAAERAE